MEESRPSSSQEVFSVRIVSIDYYMAPPVPDIDVSYSSFQVRNYFGVILSKKWNYIGGKVNEVPVIRVYGSTPAGQKTCLHVHRGGAVLDKILQPYESHIPFLLQFLIDYNLYGMGHLHVSKMKFRHPLPDAFLRRKPFVNRQHQQPKEKSACVAADFQEFERTGMHGAAIPSDPGKPPPDHVLRILSHGLQFMDLFADAKNYSPHTSVENDVMHSQSIRCSIDEGNSVEFGHTKSENKPAEPMKFLERSDETRLPLMHYSASRKEDRETCSQKLSADFLQKPNSVGPSDVKAADEEALRLLKWLASSEAMEDINSDDELVRETILSPLLPATTMDKVLEKANMDFEGESQQECQDILDSVDDLSTSEVFKGRPSESVDWNHSTGTSLKRQISQLDGYNYDQNSESEKSLQDCVQLDNRSSITSECKRKRPSSSPLPRSTQNVNSELRHVGFNMSSRCDTETNYGIGSCSFAGNKADKHFNVMVDKEKDDCPSEERGTMVGCSMRDLMRRKRFQRIEPTECGTPYAGKVPSEELNKDLSLCTRLRVDGQDKFCVVPSRTIYLLTDEQTKPYESSDTKSTSSLYGKLPLFSGDSGSLPASTSSIGRHHCVEGSDDVASRAIPGSGNSRMTGTSSIHEETKELPQYLHFDDKNQKRHSCEDMNSGEICVRNIASGLHNFEGSVKLLETEKLLHRDVVLTENKLFDKDDDTCKNGSVRRISTERVLEMPAKNLEGIEVATDIAFVQSGDRSGGDDSDTIISEPGSLISTVGNMEATSLKLVGMSFCKKPPVIQWMDGISGNAVLQPAIADCPRPAGEENYERPSVQDKVLDDFVPFFVEDCQKGKDVQYVRHRVDDLDYHQGRVMGIPTHYQADGSCQYMLTPVFCPPSSDSVHRWLLHEGTGSSGSRNNSCNTPLMESGSVSDVKPILDQVYQVRHNSEVQPSCDEETKVLDSEGNNMKVKQGTECSQDISQISGPEGKTKPTPLSQIGFRDPASVGGGQQLTLLSIEVQTESRGDLRPDPRFDAINSVALVVQEDDDCIVDTYVLLRSGYEFVQRNLDGLADCKVLVFSEEKHLFNHFVKIILSFDPDILMGWDIQGGSLGLLAERATHLGIGLLNSISRTPSLRNMAARDLVVPEKGMMHDVLPESLTTDSVLLEDSIIEDEWGRTHASGVHVGGRVVLNIWRLIHSEVKLNMYTAEAVAEAVLRRKIPSISYKVLTRWFSSGPGRARYRCLQYVLERAKLNLLIMNQLDMINRTSELARVFGIDFFSVLSRGSQYRVESMLLRLAHTQNYLAISPGSKEVASQPAMECIPLVMEPESGFYSDPVVVLDFQSLYPSMIIAYNLCFCTCLGKVTPSKRDTFGVSSYSPDQSVLRDINSEILLTPNGVMYVPSKVRKGVLPRLLEEILLTRIMVKQAMKQLAPSQQVLHRIFNARQLALKLIANVTYGYTAAGFSGRMPCAELADSIVQCGRRTLESAISYVNTYDKWKARVIYGDTDSMFVLLKGRSVEESFKIGYEIASSVSAMNPSPVVLKMEKVYHPCFLLTKKRYVGYSFESPDQVKPVFDAKGIETVRRDTCGAVSKTMEQSLRLFFDHQDINKASCVKAYMLRQWKRILSGRISIQDFVFAKEVRLGTYSTRASSLPPAAIVATKAMRSDPRAEPRYAERIPYVVVHGEPGARLFDMVVDPLDLMAIDSPFRLNDLYYINKQIIPALQRVFGLVGADLNLWFLEMPRPGREAVGKRHSYASNSHRTRIDYYYLSKHCILCGELVQASAHFCSKCSKNEDTVAAALVGRTSKLEREIQHLAAICRHCGGGDWLIESGVKCTSLACSVFYERCKSKKELQSLSAVATDKGFYPRCTVE
ncbi:hypothetical protein RJ640_024780, partial [Escallonia rubra]